MYSRDNNLGYLADVGIVFRWACKQYELQRADLELLLYLHQFKYFTRDDFQMGAHLYSWDKHRQRRLTTDGWIEKSDYIPNKRLGEHAKYFVSMKATRMLRRIDRILDNKEDMPLSIRNKVMTGKGYANKVLATSIKHRYK